MEDFFFTGPLDYLLFEAELAQGSRKPITLDIKRRPVETPGETTWTGFGFKQVFEGSDITFRIPSIYRCLLTCKLSIESFINILEQELRRVLRRCSIEIFVKLI